MAKAKTTSLAKRRFYLVKYEVRTGDEEYWCAFTWSSDGEEYTEKQFVQDWVNDDQFDSAFTELQDEGYFWIDDVRIIKSFAIYQVTEAEYDVLQRWF